MEEKEDKVDGGFAEVVPGVLINKSSGFKVSIPHPDPCLVLMGRYKNNKGFIAVSGDLLIFSCQEAVNKFLKNTGLEGAFITKTCPWDFLVEQNKSFCNQAKLDYDGGEGFFQTIPLRKGI